MYCSASATDWIRSSWRIETGALEADLRRVTAGMGWRRGRPFYRPHPTDACRGQRCSPAPPGLLVQVVVLVVPAALHRDLGGEPVIGQLIEPDTRLHRCRPGQTAAVAGSFGGVARL